MNILNNIITKAQHHPKTIVLAEGDDPRVIEAAVRASQAKIASCILVGDSAKIKQQAHDGGIELTGLRMEDPTTSKLSATYAERLYELRKHKGMSLEDAQQQILDPLCFSDLMLHAGDADGSIAGARYTTGERVRSALQIVGVATGYNIVSSFFLMIFEAAHHDPKQSMIFSDCALVVDPDAEQLAEIAIVSTANARKLIDDEPRVAMLSFSTHGSAKHEKVDKVRAATEIVSRRYPDLAIDGEIQLDAAIVPAIAAHKKPDSKIHGRANVLIFPDLNAANIGYKLTQRLAGATAIGPILQGLSRPANDLSRGCSSDDVFYLIALTVLQAQS
jgi:phosphate acetyltransferase